MRLQKMTEKKADGKEEAETQQIPPSVGHDPWPSEKHRLLQRQSGRLAVAIEFPKGCDAEGQLYTQEGPPRHA